ncbi:MAG: ansB [Paenibacillus sp.]|jgi:aspartate ammonia-lyase|nr:ansB [Paenibacillus sp.]
MEKMRTEEDFLGKVSVPAEALYGIYTVRTVRNLSFSGRLLGDYPAYIRSLAFVKKAAAKANYEAGVVDERICEAIEAACHQIISGEYEDQFPVDILCGGGGTGINMNMNEVIANVSNEQLGGKRGVYDLVHPVDHVSASQSSTDVCHTAMRLTILELWKKLDGALNKLVCSLDQKAVEFMPIRTIARTCFQDATTITMGNQFSGYSAVIERRRKEIDCAADRLHMINLGATVVGTGISAPEAYRKVVVDKLREVTGSFELRLRDNLFDAAQNFDDLAEVSSRLALLASTLSKIAHDFRMLSSGPEAGFAELQLPAVQPGSSFFPGKINPVVPETMIHCCFQMIGFDRTVQAAYEHGELNLNVWEGLAAWNIYESMRMCSEAVDHFVSDCVNGITVNEERCKQYAESTIPFVLELKVKEGYSTVSNMLKEAGKKGISMKELVQQGGE